MRQIPYQAATNRQCETGIAIFAGLLFLIQAGLLAFLYSQTLAVPFFGLLPLLLVLSIACIRLQNQRSPLHQGSALLSAQGAGPASAGETSNGQRQRDPYWNHLLCSSQPQNVSAVLYTPDGEVSEFIPAGWNHWTLVRKGTAIAEARRQGSDHWQIFSRKGLAAEARREPNGEWTFTDQAGQPVAWIYDSAPLESALPKRRTITIWCADGGTAGLYLLKDTQPPLFPQLTAF